MCIVLVRNQTHFSQLPDLFIQLQHRRAEDSRECGREEKKSEMGCRNRDFFADNHSSPSFDSLSEPLLFTTMFIVGLPVDVHVKDGSVYSGIFHTASAHSDYGSLLLPIAFLSSHFHFWAFHLDCLSLSFISFC